MSTSPGRVTAISFDANGTLWDFEQVMRHSLQRTLAELQRLVPAAGALTIESMVSIRDGVAKEMRGKKLEEVRLVAFKRTLQHIGVSNDALAAHLNSFYLKHRFEDVQLFDDVLPTLDALQGRFKLGLLSNGNSYPEKSGLGGRFQFVVFSQDHGVEKPDPRLFQIALEQAGCAERELLHVGDSLINDVSGAKGAGVRSVWLNRRGAKNNTMIQPDFEIASLTELVGICQKLA